MKTTSFSRFGRSTTPLIMFCSVLMLGLIGFTMIHSAYADVGDVSSTTRTTPRITNIRMPDIHIPDIQIPNIPNTHLDSIIPTTTPTAIPASTTDGTTGLDRAGIFSAATPTSTLQLGPFIKCVLLAGIGWPIPTFSTECPRTPPPPVTPPPGRSLLTIVKNTVAGDALFGFTIAGPNAGTTTISTSGGTGSVNLILDSGTTTITEDVLAGWTQTNRGCALNETSTGQSAGTLGWQIFLPADSHVTCTFVNNSNSSGSTPGAGMLKVIKLVHEGTATSSDFQIHVGVGTSTSDVAGSPMAGSATGTLYTLPAGTYTVSEEATTTYDAVFSGDCGSDGSVNVSAASTSTCTITNNFNSGVGGGGGEVPSTGGGGGGGQPSGGGGGGGGPSGGSPGGGGSPAPGQVLGASTSTPGLPNTGAGGDVPETMLTLLISLIVMLSGFLFLRKAR